MCSVLWLMYFLLTMEWRCTFLMWWTFAVRPVVVLFLLILFGLYYYDELFVDNLCGYIYFGASSPRWYGVCPVYAVSGNLVFINYCLQKLLSAINHFIDDWFIEIIDEFLFKILQLYWSIPFIITLQICQKCFIYN